MKKRVLKTLCSKALAVTVGAAMMMQAYGPTIASAAEETQYISEVYLRYGKDDASAKKWLEDNGYTVVDQNLNENAEGGGAVLSFLKLGSEKRSVYLGYKTTTDKANAIRDIRVMNMNGEYSYDEYEKVLESKKAEITSFIADMKSALAEYRANYKSGDVKAKIAHDRMNMMLDDDCGNAPLGDLLLQPIKEEMSEEEYNKEPTKHADMTTLVMQGNLDAVNSLMTYLSMAADTSKDSWMTRLRNSEGLDALIDKYEKEYPSVSESKLNSLMKADYDEQAKKLVDKINDVKEYIKAYTECSVKADSGSDKISAYFKEHTDESVEKWSKAGSINLILGLAKYDDTTLEKLFNSTEYDFEKSDDRMVLYPIIDSMSQGERALLKYVDLGDMLITGTLNAAGWAEFAKKNTENLKGSKQNSVYAGIDRGMFDPAGVALTSEARQLQSASGSSYVNKLMGIDTKYIQIAGYASSLLFIGAGIGSIVHSGTLKQTAENIVEASRNVKSPLQLKTEAVSGTFCKYLKDHNVEGIVGFSITDNMKQEHMNGVFRTFAETYNQKDTTLVVTITENGKSKMDMVDITGYVDGFIEASKDNQKAFNDYVNASKAAFSEQAKLEKANKQRVLDNFTSGSKGWKIAGVVMCIAGAIIAVGSAALTVRDVYKYYHQDYAPIPRKIVHESSDDKGRSVYTVYDCTLCNRSSDKDFKNDKLGDYGDLNGDVGKQWLALYTTKDKAAGDPITADIIAQKGSNTMPTSKATAVRMFGKTDALNVVSEEYGYNDKLNGLYIFAATDTTKADEKPAENPDSSAADSSSKAATEDSSSKSDTKAAASVIGAGTLTLSCVGSAAVGALIAFLIVRKKKDDKAA